MTKSFEITFKEESLEIWAEIEVERTLLYDRKLWYRSS